MFTLFLKWLYVILGYLGLSAGIILVPLPIPLGLPLIAISLVILLRHSLWFRRGFLYWYRHEPRLRNWLRHLRRRKPKRVA